MNHYAFFESTLPKLRTAKLSRSPASADAALLAAARHGFADFGDGGEWTEDYTEYVQAALADEYNPAAMAEFDDSRDALCYFALYAIGALLGQWASDALDDAGFVGGREALPGFLLNEVEAIEAAFAPLGLPPLAPPATRPVDPRPRAQSRDSQNRSRRRRP